MWNLLSGESLVNYRFPFYCKRNAITKGFPDLSKCLALRDLDREYRRHSYCFGVKYRDGQEFFVVDVDFKKKTFYRLLLDDMREAIYIKLSVAKYLCSCLDYISSIFLTGKGIHLLFMRSLQSLQPQELAAMVQDLLRGSVYEEYVQDIEILPNPKGGKVWRVPCLYPSIPVVVEYWYNGREDIYDLSKYVVWDIAISHEKKYCVSKSPELYAKGLLEDFRLNYVFVEEREEEREKEIEEEKEGDLFSSSTSTIPSPPPTTTTLPPPPATTAATAAEETEELSEYAKFVLNYLNMYPCYGLCDDYDTFITILLICKRYRLDYDACIDNIVKFSKNYDYANNVYIYNRIRR
ncbi:MAG: hypothetical protein DRJ31_11085, partial [Candidatus Methanomethylicota archaeon]